MIIDGGILAAQTDSAPAARADLVRLHGRSLCQPASGASDVKAIRPEGSA